MRIFYDDTYLDVICDDDSERVGVVNNVESVTLNYSLPSHVKLPTGAYIEFQGKRYTLFKPRNFKKHNSRNFEYTVIFEDYGARAKAWTFKFPETGELKFELIYTPRMFLDLFVENMNMRDSGWEVGSCIEAAEKPIAFSQVRCFDALGLFADAFETEFELDGKTVSLGKVEYNKANPLEISYKAGFKAGVECNVDDESSDIEILNVQGGNRNINYTTYGSKNLLLPKGQSINYDGTYFEDEAGFDESKTSEYIVNSDGLSIQRADREIVSYSDDNLDCEHIYPSWEHIVTKVEKVDGNVDEDSGIDNGFWNIYAENTTDHPNNSPATLNYEDCRIPAEKATVIFQSGMLSSKEFDIVQSESYLTGYDYETKKFELVSIAADSQVLPNDTHKPKVGDKFKLFHTALPSTYICDNDTKTGASWDMFREAVKYLYEREQVQISIDGTLDGIWAKKGWLSIGGKLVVGGYAKVSDVDFAPNGIVIRITEIRQSVNNPHSPEIKLSNKVVTKEISSTIKRVASNEVKTDVALKELKNYNNRSWADTKQTTSMLMNALLNFSGEINPIVVRTMQMLVGDESLQFRFVDDKTTPTTVPCSIAFNSENKVLKSEIGIIQHMTLGINSLSSSHTADEYKYWSIEAYTSSVLADPTKRYYLYIKASKTEETAVMLLSETAIELDEVAGHYHFLTGILNSEYDGDRSFVTMFGYTEILPGRMTIEKIMSPDGEMVLDLVNKVLTAKGSATISAKNLMLYVEGDDEYKDVMSMFRQTSNTINLAVQSIDNITDNLLETGINITDKQITLSGNTVFEPSLRDDLKGDKGDKGDNGKDTGINLLDKTSDHFQNYVSYSWYYLVQEFTFDEVRSFLANDCYLTFRVYISAGDDTPVAARLSVWTSAGQTNYVGNGVTEGYSTITVHITNGDDITTLFLALDPLNDGAERHDGQYKEPMFIVGNNPNVAWSPKPTDVALNLGYDSYAQMVANAKEGKVIIKDGKIYGKGLDVWDATFRGSVRQGLQYNRSFNEDLLCDDIVMTGDNAGGFSLDNITNKCGRTIRIFNNGSSVPITLYGSFIEDGHECSHIKFSNEIITLYGFGNPSGDFMYWVVLDRTNFKTTGHWGRHHRVVALFEANAYWGTVRGYTYDGGDASVTFAADKCSMRVTMPAWFDDENKYTVFATGMPGDSYYSNLLIKPTVRKINGTQFEVKFTDDASVNPGGASIVVYPLGDWFDRVAIEE